MGMSQQASEPTVDDPNEWGRRSSVLLGRRLGNQHLAFVRRPRLSAQRRMSSNTQPRTSYARTFVPQGGGIS